MERLTDKIRLDMAWFTGKGYPVPPEGGTFKIWLMAIKYAIFLEAFHAVFLYRLYAATRKAGWRIFGYFLGYCFRSRFASEIAPGAEIGGGFRLPHPYGIVIGEAKIGKMVTIGQNVTLGANFDEKDDTGEIYPTLGNWTLVTKGAAIVGPVRIGEDVIIAPNAVVTNHFPDHAIIGGIPAQVLKMKTKDGNSKNIAASTYYFGFSDEVVRRINNGI